MNTILDYQTFVSGLAQDAVLNNVSTDIFPVGGLATFQTTNNGFSQTPGSIYSLDGATLNSGDASSFIGSTPSGGGGFVDTSGTSSTPFAFTPSLAGGTDGSTGVDNQAGFNASVTQPQADATVATLPQSPSSSLAQPQTDPRVRIAHLSSYPNPYPGVMSPLAQTQGMMFPFTPSIQVSQDVDYAHMSMSHSNTDYYAFSRAQNATVSISGKFSVQNQQEGQYALAALYFLRSVSKMNFGQSDQYAGLPPPILALSGYGKYMFNGIRCFLKQHSYNFDENMDMVTVNTSGGKVSLPALFTITLSLTTQHTPRAWRQDFTLDKYRSGQLAQNGNGFF
jgi:hypothetical protein